jgi:hypothetical protein
MPSLNTCVALIGMPFEKPNNVSSL